jgi:hypothetical protein
MTSQQQADELLREYQERRHVNISDRLDSIESRVSRLEKFLTSYFGTIVCPDPYIILKEIEDELESARKG